MIRNIDEKMLNISIQLSRKWNLTGLTHSCGSAFIQNKFLQDRKLAEYFERIPMEEMAASLKELNGFFGIIKIKKHEVFIAVDRVRSAPVFYAIDKQRLYISDNPYWIRSQTGEKEFDEGARHELLLTRYVTGPDTLTPNIKQLQAGEAIKIKENGNAEWTFSHIRYFTLSHNNYFPDNKEDLLRKHDEALQHAFERFIHWAHGRPVVIPLSGGYDSRLVVLMLKRLRYENIITFTYGKPDNPEAIVSRQVAQNLELPWHFVPYDSEKMYQWINSAEWKAFRRMADGLCTTCFDRDWPAIKELKKQNIIPENAIFIPGHSGDFTSGGHIPLSFCDNRNVTEQEFVEQILKRHYTMWDWKGEKEKLEPLLRQRILRALGLEKAAYINDPIDAYEKWVWQEFETKYLINGVRVFEFWGHQWWLPLWDIEYIEYWERVPLQWRIQKNLYNEYVTDLYAKLAGISSMEAKIRNDSIDKPTWLYDILDDLLNWVKKRIRQSFLGIQLKSLYSRITEGKKELPREELMEKDWEQSMGRMKKSMYEQLLPYMTCRSSCGTLEMLGYISFADNHVSEDVIRYLEKLKGE